MKPLFFCLVPLLLVGCTKHHPGVKEITVGEVAAHVKAGTASVFDANSSSFRRDNGYVPTAVLLDSYRSYDLSVLPEEKARPCVFYCSSRT